MKINWPTDKKLIKLVNQHGSYTGAARELKCDPESVRLRVRNRKLPVIVKKITPQYNPSSLLNEDAVSYYLLGAFISDGNVDKSRARASINSVDKQWIDDIKNTIAPDSTINQKGNTYTFRFSQPEMIQWLTSNECVPRKSLIVKFPNVPNKYFADFIRGIFDGDGSVSAKFAPQTTSKYWVNRKDLKKNKVKYITCYVCGSSLSFMETLSNKLNDLGLTHQFRKQKNRSGYLRGGLMKDGRIIQQQSDHYRITFNSKQAYHFLNLIYYPNNKLSLTRKELKAKEIINHYELV